MSARDAVAEMAMDDEFAAAQASRLDADAGGGARSSHDAFIAYVVRRGVDVAEARVLADAYTIGVAQAMRYAASVGQRR